MAETLEIRMARYCKFLLCPYMAQLLSGGTQPRKTPACGQTSVRILLGRKEKKNEKMVQWLGVLTAFPENPTLVPTPHTGWLLTTCASDSRESNFLSGLWYCTTHTHMTHKYTCIHLILKNLFKNKIKTEMPERWLIG